MKRNRQRGKRGSALVELSLAFPVCALLLFGTFQFGYAFFQYSRLQNGVRSGARYASLRAYDSGTATPSEAYLTAVRNVVLYGDPNGSTQPLVKGLSPANVSVQVTMTANAPSEVSVGIVNYSFDAVFTSFRWNGKPAAHFRYQGRYAPR